VALTAAAVLTHLASSLALVAAFAALLLFTGEVARSLTSS
jgi:hypothetical protein